MFLRLTGNMFILWRRLKRRVLNYVMKARLKSCGERLRFCADDSEFTYATITLGNDVHIGQRAMFIASESEIIVGNQVMFAAIIYLLFLNVSQMEFL